MKKAHKGRDAHTLALAGVFSIGLARPASAQSGGGYDLTWNSIGGGAAFSTGGAYSLGGTIGQHDAGTMSGVTYSLNGGFWIDFIGYRINLPLIFR